MGTFRSRVLYSNKKFYASEKGIPMIIPYEYGGAIHQGKWTKGTPEGLCVNTDGKLVGRTFSGDKFVDCTTLEREKFNI